MENVYIAVLDVLGFTSLVHDDSKIGFYLKSLNESLKGIAVEYVVFSDSIILTTKTGDAEALSVISSASAK